ncbi:MAG: glycosyltransferase [Deltaproteobacteria bacterium]
MRKTVIVVPCFNEEKRLDRNAFTSALQKEKDLFFIFVNDGSGDKTLGLLESMRKEAPSRISVIDLEKNFGKAEAVRRGILKAIEGPYENVGYWDADLSTPIDAVFRFCNILETTETTLVLASRVRLLGRRVDRKLSRHYFGRVFATFASLLLRISVYDTQCGAKIFRNGPVLKKVFGRPFKVNWTFDVEMLARFHIIENKSPEEISSKWIEYPVEEWADVKGSKVKGRDFIKSGLELCYLFVCLYTPARKGYEIYLRG